MATAHDNFEKSVVERGLESGSEKEQTKYVDEQEHAKHADENALPPTISRRVFQAPEFIRNMSPEERATIESRLKRKIDARLMPMIILM